MQGNIQYTHGHINKTIFFHILDCELREEHKMIEYASFFTKYMEKHLNLPHGIMALYVRLPNLLNCTV